MANSEGYLFVLPWTLDHVGGVNQVVLNLAKEMHDAGRYDPIVLTADWGATRPILAEYRGLRTIRWRVRSYRARMGPKEAFAYHLWERRFAKAFGDFCRRECIAAINVHYPTEASFALERVIARARLMGRLILSFHGSDFLGISRSSPGVRDAWRGLLTRVPAVACSQSLASQIATLGETLDLRVIHNGVTAARLRKEGGDPTLPWEKFILNVGKFELKKGQKVLLNAFAEISGAYPALHLVLIGASGPELPSLIETITLHGMESRVHILRDLPHDEVMPYFRNAKLFALPSHYEPFAIVLLEAGTFGLPIVASRVGGVPELIPESRYGVLVPPDDPAKLAQELRALLDDPIGAREMGARFRERVLAHFTWRAAVDQYVGLADASGVEPAIDRPKGARI